MTKKLGYLFRQPAARLSGIALGAALLGLCWTTPASADIILVDPTTITGGDVENVLLADNNQQGTTITGVLNQSGTIVSFSSNETLINPATGQSRIDALDGTLTLLNIALQDADLGFGNIEFNINSANNGTATLTFTDQFGDTEVYEVILSESGVNRFGATAINGQVIKNVNINSTTGITLVQLEDIRQVRLGPVTSAVPEPGLLALLGSGLLGLGLVMRRRKTAPMSEAMPLSLATA